MRRRPDYVLLAILAAALALRLPHLGYSFYGDEMFSLLRDSSRFLTTSEDRFRPVFFSLLYLWRQLGFHGEIGLRVLPLIFGLAQIPLAYWIGRKLGGEALARAFGILMAVSPMLIEFSQELRMYSMVAFLALLQVWIFLKLRERSSLGWWIAFVAVTWIGVYTHLHYWLFMAGLSLSLFRERHTIPLKESAAALGASVLLYLPNLPNLMRFSQVRGSEYAVHLPSAIPKLLAAATLGFNYFALPDQSLGRAVGVSDVTRNLAIAILAAIPAVLLLWGFVRLHRRPLSPAVWLGHELFTIPSILAFFASAVTGQYWLQPKYVIFVIPFAVLFLAASYLALNRSWARHAALLLGAAVMVVAYVHFLDPSHYGRRENWRGMSTYVRSHFTSGSALLVLDGGYSLFTHYWPQVADVWQIVRVPKENEPASEFAEDLCARLNGKGDVYYLWHDVRQNTADRNNLLLKSLDSIGQNREVVQFNPRFKLYHWSLPG
jgi:4-amino-4-deoxy-L-arabinose transferase-like glycosyltransferase